MTLTLRTCAVRSWHSSDVDSLTVHANNRNVAINLRDRFPSPYTRRDGREFIKMARRMKPESFFAIAVGGEAVGGIGFVPGHDVERVSSEIGYWLGEPFWGRGIATKNGYVLEGRARLAVVKDGRTGDRLLYALVRP